jgi:glycopeptide antibiotics resistance protein
MSRLSIKLGYWSSVLLAIVFIFYIIEVVSMTLFFPPPSWTTLADFMAAIQPVSLVVYTLIQLTAFLSMPVLATSHILLGILGSSRLMG